MFGCGGSAAPDYTPIAQANKEAAEYAYRAADNDLAFRREVYNDSKTDRERLLTLVDSVTQGQLTDAQTARDRSTEQWNQYKTTFKPIEEKMAAEAMAYGGEADQAQKAGQAVSDVRQQAGLARASMERNMASMGVNPNSGKFAAMANANSMAEAASAAGGANSARIAAKDKGIALRAGAAAFGRNQVNTAGQMAGQSTATGNAATGNANMGYMSALPYAQYASGGTGSALSAAGISTQANLGLGGLMSADYRTSSQADSGFMGMLGTLGGAAISAY